MRKLLFASAAIAAVAIAAPSFAGDDTTNNQLNRSTSQISTINVGHISVGANLTINPASVGNVISLDSSANSSVRAQNAASFASVQVNQNTLQEATANLNHSGITGSINVEAQAIGNTGSFTSDNGDLGAKTWQADIAAGQLESIGQAGAANAFRGYGTKSGEGVAFQLNDQTSQVATVNIDRISVGANIDSASAVAVGNSLSFSAPKGNASALAFQTNSSTQQLSALNVSNIGVNGSSNFNATSIGNIGSWESQTYQASDGITFQTNVSALQNSVVNVTGSGFTGGLNVGSISAGNVANIGTRF